MQLLPEKTRQPFSNLNFYPKLKITLYETDQLHHYFSQFRLQIYLFLSLSPVGLGASAYLLSTSFGLASISIAIGLFLVGLLVLVPWTLVPVLFLFTTFRANTWQRNASWAYVCLLAVSFFWWVYIS